MFYYHRTQVYLNGNTEKNAGDLLVWKNTINITNVKKQKQHVLV